jgi:hypothetical protein
MVYWSVGVMDYWKSFSLEKFFFIITPVLHYSITPLVGLRKKPLELVLWSFGGLA